MNQQEIEALVTGLENVQQSEAYGYLFFFYSDDHMTPFLTIANSDNDYDSVSNLNREGVFRINLGVRPETFAEMFAESGDDDSSCTDYTQLNTFLPHPDYAKQHFVCILNPAGENESRIRTLIQEAWELARRRYERRHA